MGKLNNGPSISLIIFLSILYNLLCYFLGTDIFYSLVSFVLIISLPSLAIYFLIKKDFENFLIIITIICITETIYRKQNYIPYLFSFYSIIAFSFYHFLLKPKKFFNSIKMKSFISYMGLLLLLMIVNKGGSTNNYLVTLRLLGIPILAILCITYFISINKIKISFEKMFNYMLLFLGPLLSNLIFFGDFFGGRIWPPWDDGTGPVAGLAAISIIISVYMLWKKNQFLYLIPLYFSSVSIIFLASRGAIIALLISLIISGLYFLLGKNYRLLSKQTLLFMILIVYLSNMKIADGIKERFDDIGYILASEKRSSRMFVLISTYDAYIERPLYGGGTGSFLSEYLSRTSEFDINIRRHGLGLIDAHSFILQNIFEHGLIGVVITGFFFFHLITTAFNHARVYNVPTFSLILFIVLYSFTTALKHSIYFVPLMLISLGDIKTNNKKLRLGK